MRKHIALIIVALGSSTLFSGCQSVGGSALNLTPAQDAMLVCLVANVTGTVVAKYQADGTALCTLATGAAVIVGAK